MDTYKVENTLFRFPTPPPSGGRGAELLAERREAVLTKARAIRPRRSKPPLRWPTARPNTLGTNPPKPAGWHGPIGDGETGTVQMAGPDGGAWCVTEDGRWVLATKGGGVRPAPAFGLNTKLMITDVLIEREVDTASSLTGFRHWGNAVERHRVTAQLAWWAWHHLYPAEPFPVDELVYTPTRDAEKAGRRAA